MKINRLMKLLSLRAPKGRSNLFSGIASASPRNDDRLRLAMTLFLLLATVLSGCVKREIKNIESTGTNIVCFGDSITFGYGADGGEEYPSFLAKMLTIPVINAGIDGDTTTEALKRVESDILERDPLLVIIEFGGNDFLKKIPLKSTVENVRKMVDLAQGKGAMVAIADISAGIFLKEYSAAFKKIAREKQLIFIPSILSGIITNPSMKSDFIHPNANGYKAIAFRVYREIRPYLNKNILLNNPRVEKSQKKTDNNLYFLD